MAVLVDYWPNNHRGFDVDYWRSLILKHSEEWWSKFKQDPLNTKRDAVELIALYSGWSVFFEYGQEQFLYHRLKTILKYNPRQLERGGSVLFIEIMPQENQSNGRKYRVFGIYKKVDFSEDGYIPKWRISESLHKEYIEFAEERSEGLSKLLKEFPELSKDDTIRRALNFLSGVANNEWWDNKLMEFRPILKCKKEDAIVFLEPLDVTNIKLKFGENSPIRYPKDAPSIERFIEILNRVKEKGLVETKDVKHVDELINKLKSLEKKVQSKTSKKN